jgi:hypothetical protein
VRFPNSRCCLAAGSSSVRFAWVAIQDASLLSHVIGKHAPPSAARSDRKLTPAFVASHLKGCRYRVLAKITRAGLPVLKCYFDRINGWIADGELWRMPQPSEAEANGRGCAKLRAFLRTGPPIQQLFVRLVRVRPHISELATPAN